MMSRPGRQFELFSEKLSNILQNCLTENRKKLLTADMVFFTPLFQHNKICKLEIINKSFDS